MEFFFVSGSFSELVLADRMAMNHEQGRVWKEAAMA
jgi:hypothetical protein